MRQIYRRFSAGVFHQYRSSVSVKLLLAGAVVAGAVIVGYAVAQDVAGEPTGADDWPMYMLDNSRSGCTRAAVRLPLREQWVYVPKAEPEQAWADPHEMPVEGILEYPKVKFDDAYHVAVADGRVYFGTSDNKVYCLDATSGQVKWRRFTGGPVRLSPTVSRGRVYVGCDDGYAYCFKADDGSERWKVCGGPTDERLIGSGRMISMWPVRTSVVVYDNTAYFGAGVFPGERVFLYAVGADDGKLVWQNDTMSDRAAGQDGFSPQGYALVSKDYLFFPSGRALPACFDRLTGQFRYQKGYSRWTYGPLGGSWALLANGNLFAGVGPIYGYEQQTGNIGFAAFPTGRQLVVSPDTAYMLSVDGITALDRQAYPRASWEARRLAERREALIRAKPQDLDAQLKALQEEEKKNEADKQAATRWQYERKALESMIVAGDLVFAGGADEVVALEKASGKEVWLGKVDGRARGLAVAGGRLFVSTDKGKIHCFGSSGMGAAATVQEATTRDPFPRDTQSALFAAAADAIVKQSGATKGYCLVLGCGSGRLAYELAQRTELKIYGVDSDAAKVAAAREALDAAGVYGTRVTVDQCDLNRPLPYSDYFANLIVSEDALVSGELIASAEEALRMLKPCGGVMLLGQPAGAVGVSGQLSETALRQWMDSAKIKGYQISTAGGLWAKLERGELEGADDWTHQYGEPGNTASSNDTFVKGPFGVLWYGEPGPNKVPSRHIRNVVPLCMDGRVYLQGINRVMCFDAYNGTSVWEREIEGAYRVGTSHEAGNLAANKDSLFVATGAQCLRLDGLTGETRATYPSPGKTADGKTATWAYVAVVDNLLYGSTAIKSQFSDSVFAYDIDTGKLVWRHTGKTIRNVTISISDGRMLFADDRATATERSATLQERTAELKAKGLDDAAVAKELAKCDVRIVIALDAKTGEKVWEKPVDLTGCGADNLIAMAHKGVLAFTGAYGDGHYWNEFLGGAYADRRVVALSTKDGSPKWSKAVGCRIRPLIVGGTLYAEPWAFDLQTGEQKMRVHPLTDRKTVWEWERPGHHCGCISGSPNGLYFRSGCIGYYDLIRDQGTEHFGGQRPGCWINQIPAAGLVIVPEASSGCVCLYSIQCTTVFKPRAERKAWGIYASRGDLMPIKNLRLSLGAPGDRTDSKGRLWLSYPRPGGRMRLNLQLAVSILPGCGYYGEPSELARVAGTEDPWLYASGCVGLTNCLVPLVGEGDGRAEYIVRLGFSAPDTDRPGQRVFDIKLQGKVVEQDFDVVKAAGGPDRAVIKEFRGIPVDKDLKLELVPKLQKPDKTRAPLINTIEVARERVLSVGMLVPSLLLSDADAETMGEIVLANRGEKEFVGSLQVTAPPAFALTLSEDRVRLAPDATMKIRLAAKVVTKGPPARHAVDVRLVRQDGMVDVQRQVVLEYLGPRKRQVIRPSVDTFVSAGAPTADNSKSTTILVDGGAERMGDASHNIAYLRFPVDVPGKVVSVVFRIRTAQAEYSESNDSGVICLVEGGWDPAKLSYNNRPKPGQQVAKLGSVGRDVWEERPLQVDLTGMKELNLVIEPTSCDGATYMSSETDQGPELVIEYEP